MPNTNNEMKMILNSIILQLEDMMYPEKTNLRFSNLNTFLNVDNERHNKPYAEVSFSWNVTKHGGRIHDEVIHFSLSDDVNDIRILDLEADINLKRCDDDFIRQSNDKIQEIISTNKHFAKIGALEMVSLTRLSRIDAIENDTIEQPKEEYHFKSVGRLQKHIHLHGIVEEFNFNGKTWVIHEKSSAGDFTSYTPSLHSERGKIVVTTEDFNGILGYSDASVRLIA